MQMPIEKGRLQDVGFVVGVRVVVSIYVGFLFETLNKLEVIINGGHIW